MSDVTIKQNVRKRYGAIAASSGAGCCGPSGCGPDTQEAARSATLGYSKEDLEAIPESANLGLGCGNPLALASLSEGETVLDLGSGAGIDCFLAARRVGESGRVIGVDMTPEMLDRARENAKTGGYTNVEFRKGEIEALPVDDATVDVVISNCVINLSPDKPQVFREIARVLKPGGRFYVSDIVLAHELPDSVKSSAAAYAGCVAGALLKDDYLAAIRQAGLAVVDSGSDTRFPLEAFDSDPTVNGLLKETSNISKEDTLKAASAVLSTRVEGTKPVAACCGG